MKSCSGVNMARFRCIAKNLFCLACLSSVLFLWGCATGGATTVTGLTATNVWASFKAGDLRMNCGFACSASWGPAGLRAKAYRDNKLWTDLALEVGNVGYRIDLSYFYLAQAAEGLGYFNAARGYYKLAMAVDLKCNGLFNICEGVDIPREVERALSRLPSDDIRANTDTKQEVVVAVPIQINALADDPGMAPIVLVKYDEFEKTSFYNGEDVGIGGDYLALRAWKKDLGATRIQIYVISHYVDEWRFYDSAWDSDGNRLSLTRISAEVDECRRYSVCTHTEHIAVGVTSDYLESRRASGVRFKIKGKGGELVLHMPGAHIAAFLDAIK